MQTIDWAVIGLYGLVVLVVGLLTGRGHQTQEDLFLGSRRIPAWAAFGSMIATEISAATFVAVPASAYGGSHGWFYLQYGLGSVCARVFLVYFFLRVFYELRVVTVYQFLRGRFGRGVELGAAWLFLCGRILASGTRLFIAALAFATVTDLSMEGAIVIAGSLAAAYTLIGGIRAVIWTDVIQGVVFIVAACTAVVVLGNVVDGGWGEILSAASLEEKTKVFHFSAFETTGTSAVDTLRALFGQVHPLWVMLLAGFFLTLASHGTDQDMVQRLLTTRSSDKGGAALIWAGVAAIPVAAVFLLIGTGLWYFYQGAGGGFDGSYSIADTDRILPIFVLHEMPTGLRGLIFAGLFAAAMSSMDSALNSLATTWIVDIRGTERSSVVEIRITTVVFAVLLVGAALACVRYRDALAGTDLSLIGLALGSMTVLYGGLLGAFLVGLLTPRGTARSVIAGMLVSAAVGIALMLQPIYIDGAVVIAWPWWVIFGTVISFGIGASAPGEQRHRDARDLNLSSK